MDAATAVPASGIVSCEFAALLTRDSEPVAVPAMAGVNMTGKVKFRPAGIVNESARPAILKPFPETSACEIMMLLRLLLERVIDCELVSPSAPFSKRALAGTAARWPVDATPIPV